ncbi:MAG: GNAT family N-acetyltransferase [Lacisediminihabitans sp.]
MTELSKFNAQHERHIVIEAIGHTALTTRNIEALTRLFDDEYLRDFGKWNPDQPYGYAPHDVHLVARVDEDVIGHVGWARRVIGVGDTQITIAGVGGVLISKKARGDRLGSELMARAKTSMAEVGGIDFGYLGCREEVVPFYASCGWHRISATERFVGRSGHAAEQHPGLPLLILPINSRVTQLPAGVIDLRGRAW